MAAPASSDPGQPTRLDRRKARTRRALLDAARQILAERGTSDVSIQEITEQADVGFGSFYNHFATKAELFEAAVTEVLEEHGALLDAVSAGIDDPVEVFTVGVRATARLVETHPAIAQILARTGFDYLIADHGLAPRARRDLQRCIDSGRFTVSTAQLGLVTTSGCLLGYLQVRLHTPDLLGDETVDELAEQILRMLGLNARSARAVAHRPLPPIPTA